MQVLFLFPAKINGNIYIKIYILVDIKLLIKAQVSIGKMIFCVRHTFKTGDCYNYSKHFKMEISYVYKSYEAFTK